MTGRRESGVFLAKLAGLVEELVGAVALHPVFELPQMLGVFEVGKGNLVSPPRPLDRFAVDELGSGPALGRAKDDHRPARTLEALPAPWRARGGLDLLYPGEDRIERAG